MHKYFKTFFGIALFTLMLGFSSCFDIVEEYHFNANGSGTAKITVNVAQMMEMMEAFSGAMDSTGSGEDDKMDEMFDDTKTYETLKKLPGITNVQNLNSRETKMIGYSYEFANVEALNVALIASNNEMALGGMMGMMGGSDDAPEEARDNSISYTGKKFIRTMDMKMDKDSEQSDEDKQAMDMAMMMFKDAKYVINYSFDSKVKKVKKNDAAVIGADGKSVSIENTFADLLDGKAAMGCEIRLK